MTMLAPSRAARVAMARPMPREAPVMKRVLPFRLDAVCEEVLMAIPVIGLPTFAITLIASHAYSTRARGQFDAQF
jgi:hypothetical protein